MDHGGHHGHHDMSATATTTPMPMDMNQDGGHHHGDSSGDSSNPSSVMGHHSMMMNMFFHFGYNETILFEFWNISTIGELVGSMIAVFILAFVYEGLKFYREHLYRHAFQTVQLNSVSLPAENGGSMKETHKTVQVKMFSFVHGWQTILHVLQVIISYFLMLIFMTYNVWLCLAVALGAGVGYFVFGWKKSLVIDITEHCH